MRTIYDKNKTMRLLGYQYYNKACSRSIWEELKEIAEAHIEDKPVFTRGGLLNSLLDAYMLGFIYGQRAERARRKRERGQQ